MSIEAAVLDRVAASSGEEESVKRRQIIEGARAVFLTQGFDAASMNDIARAAGVSKGTLYVYFRHKEDLFEAIVSQECELQAEGIFDVDPNDHNIEVVLTRLGTAYVKFLCRPEKAAAIRTVIAIAERMPELGRKFYEAGPARGIAKLSRYFAAQVETGFLDLEDCETAAAQFMEASHAALFKPIVFNFAPEPGAEQIERGVKFAVKAFMAAHRPTAKPV